MGGKEEEEEEEEGRQSGGVLGMFWDVVGPTGKTKQTPKLSQRMAHPEFCLPFQLLHFSIVCFKGCESVF